MKTLIQYTPSLMTPKPFPKLMNIVGEKKDNQHAGLVVLMSRAKHGVVVHSETGHYTVGHRSTEWFMSMFSDFRGTVTMENDE
jgi:hypothetical protein